MYTLALNSLSKHETVGDSLQNLLATPLGVSPSWIQRDCDGSRESAEARAHRCFVQTGPARPRLCLVPVDLKEVGCLRVA